ncbi:hypothetical protein [Thermomonas mangrovi]|uniref:hypothetical protein n=1 Tax=Thermomonas mangrovi TaxID=2993316 RepID=UPI0023074C53|nr:hypothetical protein [Thermomonas mangrovi]
MSTSSLGRRLMLVATAVVVATLGAALWVMESPSKQRDRRIDERRTGELTAIANAVDAWRASKASLPPSLAILAAEPGASLAVVDPVDGTPYEYRIVSTSRYRLCARFATTTSSGDADGAPMFRATTEWQHPAGRHCFERKAGRSDDDAPAGAVVR